MRKERPKPVTNKAADTFKPGISTSKGNRCNFHTFYEKQGEIIPCLRTDNAAQSSISIPH